MSVSIRSPGAGISAALRLAGAETDARALGFERGKRTTLAIEQRVVGPAAVIGRILVPRAETVGHTPIAVFQKLVDFDPCEGFVRHFLAASVACPTVIAWAS